MSEDDLKMSFVWNEISLDDFDYLTTVVRDVFIDHGKINVEFSTKEDRFLFLMRTGLCP